MTSVGTAFPLGSSLSGDRPGPFRRSLSAGATFLRRHGQDIAELVLLLVWALFVGRQFLDMNVNMIPWGAEFSMETQSHYGWTLLARRGTAVFLCALCN